MTLETWTNILELLDKSQYHAGWSEREIDELIRVPIDLCQYVIGVNDDESLFFFATFATPEEKHIQEYLLKNRFPPEGFRGNGDELWVIDFICLGGQADVSTAFRCVKNLVLSMGYTQCFWLRTEKRRIGFHALKE